jgi:chromosome segregation ATPase
MADDLTTRVARLEESERRAWKAIEALADKEEKLDDVLVTLTEAQIKTEEHMRETDQHMRETDRHLRETDRRLRETDGRLRETDGRLRETGSALDARIDKLVSAVGEMLRQRKSGE